MLFKNIAEIKEYLPIHESTEFANLKPFIRRAEKKFIIPAISKAQYDNLNNAYNASSSPTLSGSQNALLLTCQAALAQYFFFMWIPSGQLSIGDNGIRISTTETLKTSFQWQVFDLLKSTLQAACEGMDELLAYMEENKGDYPLWAASSSYTQFKESFIVSAARFTELFSPLGGSRLNFQAIRSSMMKEQNLTIKKELGDAFYTELHAQHMANNPTAANKKIITMIQEALAPLTMTRALTELSVLIDEHGILNFNNTAGSTLLDPKQPAKDSMISKMEMTARADARTYVQLMKEFLSANITDYPTYAGSTAYNSDTTDSSYQNSDDAKTFFMG